MERSKASSGAFGTMSAAQKELKAWVSHHGVLQIRQLAGRFLSTAHCRSQRCVYRNFSLRSAALAAVAAVQKSRHTFKFRAIGAAAESNYLDTLDNFRLTVFPARLSVKAVDHNIGAHRIIRRRFYPSVPSSEKCVLFLKSLERNS
jgi:hypothetical protein